MPVPTQLQTPSPAEPRTVPQADPPSRRSDWWPMVRPLVLRLHFYAGVLVAPFILVASVTGLLYTIAPQVEQIAYRELTDVGPAGGQVTLAEQVAAARATHPAGAVIRVDVPEAADRSTRVVFTDETVPTGYDMSVFVNPYTGQVEGQVRSYGQWLGFRAWLDDLHRNLHLGALGRNYSELAASWLWVVALGGLALWIAKRRRERRTRRLLTPDPSTSSGHRLDARGRARVMSWHGAIGVWVLLGALVLSVSGVTWSRYAGANVEELRTALAWMKPLPTTSLEGETSSVGHEHHGPGAATSGEDPDALLVDGVGIDGVLAAAREEGLGDPLYLTPPTDADSAWTAAENKRDWPTSYDTVAVDPASGAVVDRVDFADWPVMAKLTTWSIGAHMGILFGVANQIVLAAVAIGLIALTLLGYRMWWLRRPRGTSRLRFGRPVPRGAWRRLPRTVLAGGVAVTVLVGWFFPLLGISLVAFLLIDLALALASRRGRAG
ncbi:PepSY domain-containing protein [Nocardioides sp.]|uniref:PepSY-associated TM helix domain-containing protein n=1 Tax=Nocardioides sp. TaxID=35761 RepID=UPI001999FF2C|nr:PepSY domain-containing protein [Nocardioides sp.]MBC7278125.1 PepSY domain-containing protein [Nocardioides sp.]